jgi:hypothetical protein
MPGWKREASGEIVIAGRQRPDRMQMVGEDHNCVDRERTLMPSEAECSAQAGYVIHQD